jgi:hypothetical protein
VNTTEQQFSLLKTSKRQAQDLPDHLLRLPALWASLHLTTSHNTRELGYIEITHPYHPLRGQKFKILTVYKKGDQEILNIYNPATNGNMGIPRHWTDRAYPEENIESPVILSCPHLLEIVKLLEYLDQNIIQKPKEEIDG